MKKYTGFLVFLGIMLFASHPYYSKAASMHAGKVFLDVERKGDAWYIDPVSGERVLLANAAVTRDIVEKHGLGISNADLEKIPVGFLPVQQDFESILENAESRFSVCDMREEGIFFPDVSTFIPAFFQESPFTANAYVEEDLQVLKNERVMSSEEMLTPQSLLCLSNLVRTLVVGDEHMQMIRSAMQSANRALQDRDGDRIGYIDEKLFGTSPYNSDTDGDGHEDGIEVEQGYSPLGGGRMNVDKALVDRVRGRILIAVEGAGQAWYVHPRTGQRYYLAPTTDMHRVLVALGSGAPRHVIDAIPVNSASNMIQQAMNIELCKGIDCLEQGVQENRHVASVVALEHIGAISDTDVNAKIRILARHVAGIEKQYLSFELVQVDFGPIQGNEVVDAFASAEFLPEGMTTEQKAQLAKDIEEVYVHILSDIPLLMPRLHCAIENKEALLKDWQAARAIVESAIAANIQNEDALLSWMEEIDIQELEFSFETESPSLDCMWQ